MLVLILLTFINHTSGKTLSFVEEIDGNNVNETNDVAVLNPHLFFNDNDEGYVSGDPLWVLHLNNAGWMDPKLAQATPEEQEIFYDAVGTMIGRSDARQTATKVINKYEDQQSGTQQASNDKNTNSDKDLKREITTLINKFALSTSVEPDSYLNGNDKEKDPSIALYFKGPVTCLIVILGDKQWHYILETSPFPAWFYENYDTSEAPLKIPDHIRHMFFQVLLRLLKLVFSIPL